MICCFFIYVILPSNLNRISLNNIMNGDFINIKQHKMIFGRSYLITRDVLLCSTTRVIKSFILIYCLFIHDIPVTNLAVMPLQDIIYAALVQFSSLFSHILITRTPMKNLYINIPEKKKAIWTFLLYHTRCIAL